MAGSETVSISTERARPGGRNVTLRVEACLTAQRPGLPCTTCRDTCPGAAIRISDRHVEVSDAACSGCGRCAVSCPTGALTVVGFKPASTFECMRVNAGADEVVPCLGGIPSSHLRRALAEGDVTLMDRGWCAGCPVSGGTSAPWSHAVDKVNEEAELLGLTQRVRVQSATLPRWRARAAPAAATANPSRRALFSLIAQTNESRTPSKRLPALPEKVDSAALHERRAELLALSDGRPLPAGLFPSLNVVDATLDIHLVAAVCPTAALAVAEAPAEDRLIFDAALCTGCGGCARISEGALSVSKQGAAGGHPGTVVLVAHTRRSCARCHERFTPQHDQTLCDNCHKDTELAVAAHRMMRRPGA